ncbi:uncharacterized protein [Dermacentor andersoni]|uniref:uncharacterized protein isoform X1 n=1 Tax=Dermacentor andersoni TaxID=34620 RepID=UPI00215518DC|nr:uncharacterized protein LOC126529085 isoform X1 [Dermacentor andersoni]
MASSSSNDESNVTTETFLRSGRETTSISYVARLAAEASKWRAVGSSQVKGQVVELQARQAFDYLRPSRVEKLRDAMNASLLKLTASEEKARSQLGEGRNVVASRQWAKECESMALLVHNIVNWKPHQGDIIGDVTWKDFDLEKLEETHKRFSRAADAIDADIKELQLRIGRL